MDRTIALEVQASQCIIPEEINNLTDIFELQANQHIIPEQIDNNNLTILIAAGLRANQYNIPKQIKH